MNKTESINPKYIVQYKGEDIAVINSSLIKKNKISDTALEAIKAFHILKEAHLEELKNGAATGKVRLRKIASNITNIEFSLQKLWGFEPDKNYHRFWKLPQCTCPTMDNEDAYPTGYYVVNQNCILHGK